MTKGKIEIEHPEFDRDLRATIKELNSLRKRVREIIESEDTPIIVDVMDMDFDFVWDFVRGVSEEVMIETHEIEFYDEAKPYWELLEWGEK